MICTCNDPLHNPLHVLKFTMFLEHGLHLPGNGSYSLYISVVFVGDGSLLVPHDVAATLMRVLCMWLSLITESDSIKWPDLWLS